MAMFDAVRKGFKNAQNLLEGKREITEENIDEALKSIRMALFEADVNFRVVKSFLERVKEKALGEIVHVSAKAGAERIRITPGDAFINICHNELEALMGPVETDLTFVQERLGPTVIMLVGLQGAGKTTTAAKLARFVQHHHGKKPMLVAADVYRPAAIEQLRVLGRQLDIPVYAEEGGNPPDIAANALQKAREDKNDVLLIDTAGRLAVDDLLMTELEEIVARVNPHNILLVVDAMIGQDAVNTAHEFNARLELDGFIMTKLDGDARGGAALSIREVTGKPIKFVGLGEGLDNLQIFQPSGFADRILGMGDIRSLVGRMENVISEKEAKSKEKDAHRMLSGDFDFSDFLEQIRMIKKMGSLTDILDMLPFGDAIPKGANIDDNELVRIESMIQSMTPFERANPDALLRQITRQRRVAKGSGRNESEVKDLLQRFTGMRSMLQSLGGAGGMGGMLGGGGGGLGGLMGKIPGMKGLSQMNQLRNMDLGSLMGGMGGGMEGMDPFTMMQQRQQQQQQLPKGFSQPGVRMAPADAAKSEKARKKAAAAKKARKKGRS